MKTGFQPVWLILSAVFCTAVVLIDPPRTNAFQAETGTRKVRTHVKPDLHRLPPEPVRVAVDATGPGRGPENAPIKIVEFGDFQCPFCARLVPVLEQVFEKYGSKVRLVFRQFPLPFHSAAFKAAEASLCANDQGKFWDLHEAMYENQQQLQVDNLKAKATALGMNAEQFNSCLDSGKFSASVQADTQAGNQAGVLGTPALFINGRFISGAVPLDQITKIIDDELRRNGR